MLLTKVLLCVSAGTFIAALVIFKKDTRTRLCAKSPGVILDATTKMFNTTKFNIKVFSQKGTFVLDTYAIYTQRKYNVGERVEVILDTLDNGNKVVYLVDGYGKPIYDTLMAKLSKYLTYISALSFALVSLITLIKTLLGVII